MLDATASSPSISTSGSTTARFVSVGSRMIPDPLTMSGFGGVPDGEYDGGAKHANLFLFNAAVQQEDRVCLGFISQEKHRFCLRPATIHDPTLGKWYCGMQHHLVQFEPAPKTFYPRANEIIALCSPFFPLVLVPQDKIIMVKSPKCTIQEWAQLFKSFLGEATTLEPAAALRQIGFATTVPLKTLSKAVTSTSTKDSFPYESPAGIRKVESGPLALDESTWASILDLAGFPDDVSQFLLAARDFILDYENWWRLPIDGIRQMLTVAQANLHTLKATCEMLSLNLGTAVEIDEMYFPDTWTAISYAASCFATSPEYQNLTDHIARHEAEVSQIQQVWGHLQALQAEMIVMNDTLDKFDQ
jgi:hypothetical protein